MCGIAGYWNHRSPNANFIEDMVFAIHHRGPDKADYWCDEQIGLYLGHARLSILDLSEAGNQPMSSASGRYIIVFNGEIYNHLILRQELERTQKNLSWRGHSDTETLLAGFDHWGIRATLEKAIGMFGFALWDKKTGNLTLGRDRLGEKPLYYGWQNGCFLFGSELSAIKKNPIFKAEINRDAITLLMRHNCIPAPYTIYKDIHKLPPGNLLTISPDKQDAQPVHYWNPSQIIPDSLDTPFQGTDDEAIDALEVLLKDAVKKQMISDVPLGAFLSGGIDSSVIAALMQAQSDTPVKTFTIGTDASDYNEAEHAKAVARHIGTDHTELYVSSAMARDVIPDLPRLFSEPFSDSSQIPTFLVSQLARQHVTVSLSGDGGDELFGGYNRYVLGQNMWGKASKLPVGLRTGIAKFFTSHSPTAWNKLANPFQRILPSGLAQANIGEKIHKAAGVMALSSLTDVHRHLASHWQDPEALVIGGKEPSTVFTRTQDQPKTDNAVHQMMALDLMTYLPDDILCKVDRAAMANSLETRVPMLDHRVVEFAWKLPLNLKLRDNTGKWILRQVLYRHVPQNLIDRPKMGFGIPIGDWLRGPLREWAEDLLSQERLQREGYFNPDLVRQKWQEHLSGRYNWQYHLWDVLMFQAWLQEQNEI